jgi:hypothetical protein
LPTNQPLEAFVRAPGLASVGGLRCKLLFLRRDLSGIYAGLRFLPAADTANGRQAGN